MWRNVEKDAAICNLRSLQGTSEFHRIPLCLLKLAKCKTKTRKFEMIVTRVFLGKWRERERERANQKCYQNVACRITITVGTVPNLPLQIGHAPAPSTMLTRRV